MIVKLLACYCPSAAVQQLGCIDVGWLPTYFLVAMWVQLNHPTHPEQLREISDPWTVGAGALPLSRNF